MAALIEVSMISNLANGALDVLRRLSLRVRALVWAYEGFAAKSQATHQRVDTVRGALRTEWRGMDAPRIFLMLRIRMPIETHGVEGTAPLDAHCGNLRVEERHRSAESRQTSRENSCAVLVDTMPPSRYVINALGLGASHEEDKEKPYFHPFFPFSFFYEDQRFQRFKDTSFLLLPRLLLLLLARRKDPAEILCVLAPFCTCCACAWSGGCIDACLYMMNAH